LSHAALEETGFSEQQTSEWVKKNEGFSKFIGMPCEKIEKEIMALFASIEASRNKNVFSNGSPSSTSMLAPKGGKELKRLDCSINYVSKDIAPKSGSRRGRVSSVPL
jgi:hypothetical protein